MKINQLSPMNDDLLVFGGCYSNLQALEALYHLAISLHIPPERIICTGDVVGYCAQPEEVVQRVKNWGVHCIAGNVELQLRSGALDCGCDFRPGSRCDTFSQRWYPFAKKRLSPDSIAWMEELPDYLHFDFYDHPATVVHGDFGEVAGYVFQSTPWEVKQQTFANTGSRIILAGHCGLPFAQQRESYHWLNAGVIGMPANDGTPRVWCMLLQKEDGEIRYRHIALEYDFLTAQRHMREQGLPEEYALTLSTGIWDNCEILPDWETQQQGVSLLIDPVPSVGDEIR